MLSTLAETNAQLRWISSHRSACSEPQLDLLIAASQTGKWWKSSSGAPHAMRLQVNVTLGISLQAVLYSRAGSFPSEPILDTGRGV